MLLYLQCAPKNLDGLAGNDETRMQIRRWVLDWLRNKKHRPLLIHGPVGTGKTTVAYALKNEYDLELIQMSASDLRDKGSIERVFSNAIASGSLSGKQKILLIDDVDAFQKADSGGIAAISKLLRTNSCPIILTAVDIWDKKLAGIRNECELAPFKRVTKTSIAKVLVRINESESLDAPEELIARIAESSNGDVRSAINDLQSRLLGGRDREKDIFENVRAIFKATAYAEAKKVTYGGIDYGLLKLWIDENIPAEYETELDIARAYYYLSRADLFEGRIRNSYWTYLKYSFDMISAGVALSKEKPYRKFTKYQFPKYLKEMGATVARRAMLKEIGKKIGAKVHANRKDALSYLNLIRHWSEIDQDRVVDLYGFEEEELAFILETTVESIKKTGKAKEKKKAEIEEDEEEGKEDKKAESKENKSSDEKKKAEDKDELKPVPSIQKEKSEKEKVPESKDKPKETKEKKKGSGTLMEFI
ncbi:MAG: replication factor C large subunit [Candidatus Micrarchaeia archaeon]